MENREIILSLLKNERLKPSDTFIGHEGDHLCTTLKVTHNDAFDDFKVHLKFENVDKTFLSKSLTYTSGDYYDDFKVPQVILKKGNILCQLLFLKPIEETENLENLDEENIYNLVVRQSSIVTFNCGAKIASAVEGIDPNVGLVQLITDGDGTKFLSDNGKYYQINNNELLEKINNKQEKLTAGENITIDENNVISATGGNSNRIIINSDFDLRNWKDETYNGVYETSADIEMQYANSNTLLLPKGTILAFNFSPTETSSISFCTVFASGKYNLLSRTGKKQGFKLRTYDGTEVINFSAVDNRPLYEVSEFIEGQWITNYKPIPNNFNMTDWVQNEITNYNDENLVPYIDDYEPTEYNTYSSNKIEELVVSKQAENTFYGLAKASGDTTQATSNNPIGTYTDEAKASIQEMLGISSTSSSGHSYSTDEQVVGTWVDGKPLYEKTFVWNNFTEVRIFDFGNVYNMLMFSKDDIEHLDIKDIGCYNNDKTRACKQYYCGGDDCFRVWLDNDILRGQIGYTYPGSNNNIYVTIQYTKTADTP